MLRKQGIVGFALLLAAFTITPTAYADTGVDLLDGSTNALILGPTGIPDPAIFPGYIPTVDRLYLEPLGFPSDGTITPLITPESPDFGPSIAAGEQDLINAVEADYNAGIIGPDDPLTITAYSQSTVIVSQAEPILAAYGIPPADLDFVLLGDAASPTGILNSPLGIAVDDLLGWQNLNNTETPTTLYPTQVFVEPHDFWADTSDDTNLASLAYGFFDHGDYMGVPESVVQAALADGVTNGMTTTYALDPTPLIETLLTTALNDLGL